MNQKQVKLRLTMTSRGTVKQFLTDFFSKMVTVDDVILQQKNPSFCYTFFLENSFILLHPCTASALGSPHICSKLMEFKFLQQL